MKFNKPMDLYPTQIIIAVQSLYAKKVSTSIETCFEIVQEFAKHGVCKRRYRKKCSIVKTTVYDELLRLVPYNDRKLYENNKELFGIDNLDIEIKVLRIFRNNKLIADIDITNNQVLFDADRPDDDNIVYNQLMVNVRQDLYKSISSIVSGLSSEENKEFYKNQKTYLCFDGLCSDLVDPVELSYCGVSHSYESNFSNVRVHININLLGDIYKNMVSTNNTEPVLLASGPNDDNLFIRTNTDGNIRWCEMYIERLNVEVPDSGIKIENPFDIYLVFNAMVSFMNNFDFD